MEEERQCLLFLYTFMINAKFIVEYKYIGKIHNSPETVAAECLIQQSDSCLLKNKFYYERVDERVFLTFGYVFFAYGITVNNVNSLLD